MEKRDPYDVLGVSREATPDEIKSAYRKLARKHHPDVNQGDPAAEEKFKEVGGAYALLSDPEKRAVYDRYGTTDEQPPMGDFFQQAGGFGDIFEMFFGGNAAGGRSRGRDGQDLRLNLRLTLQEVVTGVKREVEIQRSAECEACHGNGTDGGIAPDTCSTCNGQGMVSQIRNTFVGQVRTSAPCPTCAGTGTIIKVPCPVCRGRKVTSRTEKVQLDVPPGVESGATMHMNGLGNDGTDGGRPGDLYVVLAVEDDARFERDGQRLYTRLPLTFAQMTLGDNVKLDGVDNEVTLNIPAGTQPGTQLKVKHGGFPPLHGGRRGDLIAIANVVIPTDLDAEQVDLVKKLAEGLGEVVPQGEEKAGFLGGLFGKKK